MTVTVTYLVSGPMFRPIHSIVGGFELPPLEAMACGTPVVCSNTSSFPEVVGNAALMVNPLDAEALAKAITMVLKNTNLRVELSSQGVRSKGFFSWESTARVTLDVYRRAGAIETLHKRDLLDRNRDNL